MGSGVSLPTLKCEDCSLQFRHSESNLCCPRCGSTSITATAREMTQPTVFLTPSGLVISEETLRQLVSAHLPAAAGDASIIESLITLLQNPGAYQDSELLEVIARSITDGSKQAPPASEQAWLQLRSHSWDRLDEGTSGLEECAICLSRYEMVCCVEFFVASYAIDCALFTGGKYNAHAVWSRASFRLFEAVAPADKLLPILQVPTQSAAPSGNTQKKPKDQIHELKQPIIQILIVSCMQVRAGDR
jgi:hypothetical protein